MPQLEPEVPHENERWQVLHQLEEWVETPMHWFSPTIRRTTSKNYSRTHDPESRRLVSSPC